MESTILYKKNGPYRGPKNTTYDFIGVNADVLEKTLENGKWFKTIDEALECKAKVIAKKVDEPKESDYGSIKSYNEIPDSEKKIIGMLILDGVLEDKEICKKFNVHHMAFRKLKKDVLD